MGFESFFTLYRKYNAKASENEIKEVIARYVAENKEHDYSDIKKSDDEYAKDLPAVLELDYGLNASEYDEKIGTWKDLLDHSIEGQRSRFKAILAADGSWLDELVNWSFGSSFNCLCEHFRLGSRHNRHDIVIDKNTAEQMLQACEYLISGEYSDKFEKILDNKWIQIFAEGNTCNSYWPYVYRNNKKELNKMDDEEKNALEYTLVNTKRALETYLKSYIRDNNCEGFELLLVYSISY